MSKLGRPELLTNYSDPVLLIKVLGKSEIFPFHDCVHTWINSSVTVPQDDNSLSILHHVSIKMRERLEQIKLISDL